MKDIAKFIVMLFIRQLLKVFYVFPVKENCILFSSFEGRQYSCNPKYLFKKIIEEFGQKYSYVWVLNNKKSADYEYLLQDGLEQKLKTVRFFSLSHFYYYLTAKYIISNLNIEPVIPKRKKQIFLATWHASGAYKNMDFSQTLKASLYKVSARDYRAKKIDKFVSGCQAFTRVYTKTWNVNENKFLNCGLPRNDLFFEAEESLNRKKSEIRARLNLSEEYGYVLFAPTYRGLNNHNHKSFRFDLDVKTLLETCEKRFNKKFILLLKNHVDTDSSNNLKDELVRDVTWYSDMQELLLISDILITDYSSSIWDFALLEKPGFLYTPDLQDYLNERGFYTPIEQWPFPFAASNEELRELIESFDEEKNKKKIAGHFSLLGSFENGSACQKIIKELGL